MTKLASNYSRVTGIPIDEPVVKEVFIALPFDKYITIQTGSGQVPKCYDFWQDVLESIRPMLDANKIRIVHLGSENDPVLNGVHDLRGKTSPLQANYVIKRTLLHLGNDSWLAHCAGANKRPLVAVYGSTSSWNHGPFWFDLEKTILIDSHRHGGSPTYAQEPIKTVNLIDPYVVANAALKLLGIKHEFSARSRFWGMLCRQTILEVIPNSFVGMDFLPDLPLSVRMDYYHNEEILTQILQSGRKVNLFVAKPINLQIIASFKQSLLSYSHEIGEGNSPDPGYVAAVKSYLPQAIFFTKENDAGKLAELRLPYFPDIAVIEKVSDLGEEVYFDACAIQLNRPNDEKNKLDLRSEYNYTWFKSNRFLLSNGKVYLSHSHLEQDQNITDLAQNVARVIPDSKFFKDLNYYAIWFDSSRN